MKFNTEPLERGGFFETPAASLVADDGAVISMNVVSELLQPSGNTVITIVSIRVDSRLERLRGTRAIPRPAARKFPAKLPNDFRNMS